MIWRFEVPAWFSVRSKTVIVLHSWNWFSSKSYRFFSSYFVTYQKVTSFGSTNISRAPVFYLLI